MRLYYEATENVPEGEKPDYIRADITDKTDTEKAEILKATKDVMAGLDYKLTEHHCGHDEKKGCPTKEIQV